MKNYITIKIKQPKKLVMNGYVLGMKPRKLCLYGYVLDMIPRKVGFYGFGLSIGFDTQCLTKNPIKIGFL